MPRLSIIVPVGRDLAAFEETLISVLENQPADCEVLVPHDGSYEDPFDLGGEVRFVPADSNSLVEAVAESAAVASGRFVHVLADGIRATPGWTEEALEKFDHEDTGVVTPVIRHCESGQIIAAGWCDGHDRLSKPAGRGTKNLDANVPARIGAYLQASFWRREVVRSLADGFRGRDTAEATYTYQHLIRAAGWRCVLAAECDVLCENLGLPWDSSTVGRGLRLRAIRNHFVQGGWKGSLLASAAASMLNLLKPGVIPESLGQGLAPLRARQVDKLIQQKFVAVCDDRQAIVSMPSRDAEDDLRRAA